MSIPEHRYFSAYEFDHGRFPRSVGDEIVQGRPFMKIDVEILEYGDGLIHVFGVIQHQPDDHKTADGLFLWIGGSVCGGHRHHADGQPLLVHPIEWEVRRSQQPSGIFIRSFALGIAQIKDIHNGYGCIPARSIGEKEKGRMAAPIEVSPQKLISLSGLCGKTGAGPLRCVARGNLIPQIFGKRYFRVIMREIVVPVIMHLIQREVIQLFEASDRLESIGLRGIIAGCARERKQEKKYNKKNGHLCNDISIFSH